MNNLEQITKEYLNYCQYQKCLDSKTLKAYRIDLAQFISKVERTNLEEITVPVMERYIQHLHKTFQPRTAKRKIASLKALFHFLEYKDMITMNPFSKIYTKFREPIILPKTIPLYTVEQFLNAIYSAHTGATTSYQKKTTLRDIALAELLFATGMRISELCDLPFEHVNLQDGTIRIYGKGSKERCLQIGNPAVLHALRNYADEFHTNCTNRHFFLNANGTPVSDQAVRRMIQKYCVQASISLHITPHMFRHTFATSLLEADVDIRYIQEMLGHSSINVTQIYTHVATAKQCDILRTKHPRNGFAVGDEG